MTEHAARFVGDATAPVPPFEQNRPGVVVVREDLDVSWTSESHFYAGLSGDVRTGGLFVATYAPLAVDTRVELQFELPTGSVRATGTVRWQRRENEGGVPGMAVALDDVEPESVRAIERFCEIRPALYYEV
jgi:uncharacterized protein (TIGR02266 family)